MNATLTVYISCLANSFRSPGAIINYLQGVKSVHLMLDLPFPCLQLYMFRMQLRGIQKQLLHCPKRAGILTPQILNKCYRKLSRSNTFLLANWAVYTIAFFSFARLANLVPRTRHMFNVLHHLTRSDVLLTKDCILIRFKWTKTIQDGSRILSIPLVRIPNSNLCPVSAYSALLSKVNISPNRSAFCYNRNGKVVTLTSHQVVTTLRHLLKAIGLDGSHFSGHSFRRSGTTWAFRAGVRTEAIKAQGDWKSSAYLNYIQMTDNQKSMISRQMADALNLSFGP